MTKALEEAFKEAQKLPEREQDRKAFRNREIRRIGPGLSAGCETLRHQEGETDPCGGAWHLRVYFDVEEEPRRTVTIQAVGIKDRSRLLIGGEEVELR